MKNPTEITKSHIIEEIMKKKDIRSISKSIVEDALSNYIQENKIDFNLLRSKDVNIIVKDVRDNLRKMHTRFQLSSKDRLPLFYNNDIDSLLKSHLSTSERISFYNQIKLIIEEINPKSILDIACGLNPLAIARKGVYYTAIDINNDEMDLIKKFFIKEDIEGKTICEDILKVDLKSLGHFDICLIFKFLDFIKDGNKVSKKLIEEIDANNFLVSFATKSISGKGRRQSNRLWFERILNKLGYEFKIFEFDNEIFYLFKKN